MQTFIQQLVLEVKNRFGNELKDICIVFPTRRAGLFFQKELSSTISTPVWSPAIFSIQDYITQLTSRNIPDDLTLIFELFEIYKNHFPGEEFASFYQWGELMLKDFDDIDKYLIDGAKVFQTISEMHEIDSAFSLAPEDMERLREFWKSFFDRDPSKLRGEFLKSWRSLGQIYISFKEVLVKKNFAYEGMAYRELAENISSIITDKKRYRKIFFAGFYALSPAEQKIIDWHLKNGSGEMLWDADIYYSESKEMEAGRFFRKNFLVEEKFRWNENHFGTIDKSIEFAGVPLLVGQAKYAGVILDKMLKENDFVSERTAVVLPDEKLLFPVLYSLPEELKDVNVTMGYPLRQTPLFNLFESMMSLRKNFRVDSSGDGSYYFRDVLDVLHHPYIRLIADREIKFWLSKLDQNFIRLPGTRLSNEHAPKAFSELFMEVTTIENAFLWFRKILKLILETMKTQDFRFHRIESEFIYHFYTQLRRFEDILSGNKLVDDIETFWRIFKEIISSVRIPFSGEPLLGLQIMGFLETRVLDFDNVILLSVNEDILPAAGNSPSFIPFNIRKAFGLPTFEEQQAVSAFHFYRLLQRAKKIYLLHNTEARGLTTGERSRFLLQLEHELQRKYPEKIKIRHTIVSTRVSKENATELIVNKDAQVVMDMSRFLAKQGKSPSKTLSASALITFITCRMRFYFKYVASLAELEEVEETIEAATFGSILHKTMQHLYNGITGIDNNVIDKLKLKIEDLVDQSIHEEFVSINQLEGKNILLRNVIRELVKRIFESEKLHTPFQILQLEKDVSATFQFENNSAVKLQGVIDRVDEKDDVIRIIDYKTGRVNKKKWKSMEEFFTNPEMKEQFQASYYAYLTHLSVPGRKIKSGLLTIREMSEGIWFLNDDKNYSDEQFSEFESHLKTLLSEMFNPAIPFTQTADDKNCGYCAYKDLCNR